MAAHIRSQLVVFYSPHVFWGSHHGHMQIRSKCSQRLLSHLEPGAPFKEQVYFKYTPTFSGLVPFNPHPAELGVSLCVYWGLICWFPVHAVAASREGDGVPYLLSTSHVDFFLVCISRSLSNSWDPSVASRADSGYFQFLVGYFSNNLVQKNEPM